jgi:large exoprotein involved in heme utilization and adhesion
LQGAGGITSATVGPGRAGNLAIAADRITLTDGALLKALTTGTGNAGDLTLSVRQLHVLNGSAISTATLGAGKGGGTTIHNAELIEVAGTSPNGEFPSSIRADSLGTGNSGRLDITADRVSTRQGGGISVSGAGTGNAGNIAINARSLFLDRGFITATSASGEGGNMTLRIADSLLLRQGSTISTTAGQARTGGNGGNINIQAGFIVAVPRENSDISANAFQGRGGNVTIDTKGLFGLQYRNHPTPLSDITASSEFGLNGNIDVNVQDPDPTRGLVELPIALVDPAAKIVARCSALTNQSNSFVVTGRAGLPQDPRQFLPGQVVIQDLRSTVGDAIVETPQTLSAASPSHASQSHDFPRSTPSSSSIIEAQGWRVNAHGDVELFATLPQTQQAIAYLNCQTLKQGESR